MRIKLMLLHLLAFVCTVDAQKFGCQNAKATALPPGVYYCAENHRSDTIDILKYTINLNVTDFVTDTIRGNTIVKFKPKLNGQGKIRLDLLKMIIDSVKSNSIKLTYTYNDTVIKINLPVNYNITDTVSVSLFYHGKPFKATVGLGGFYFNSGYAYNMSVLYNGKPIYCGRVWYPCFDNFVERSQYEFNITTDTTMSAYCNGELISDTKSGNLRTRNWILNKEIPSYLASVSISNYTQVNWSTSISTGTIPIVLTAKATDTTAMKNGFVNLKNAITGFENYYGPYVWNKVGYCLSALPAGMEYVTNISYPVGVAGNINYETLMAHELAHHWWGDLITCETQEDMWLNEGMASYSESLFKEWVYGKQKYNDEISKWHEYCLHYIHLREKSYLPVSGIPSQYIYGDHVYSKGLDMAHTLRGYLGDAAFFAGLKYVLTQKAYKSLSSLSFKALLETSSGKNLSDFFSNWIFEGGWPHFSIDSVKYIPIGAGNYNAVVSIKQKLTGAPNYFSNVPIEITYFKSNWNKVIHTYTINNANQTFTTGLNFLPVYSTIDLDNKISDAITNDVKIIKSNGTNSYLYGKATVTVTNYGADSSLLRIEHNYTSPDPIKFSQKNYKLSNQRYWKIDGILNPGFQARIKFNFDGTSLPANVNAISGTGADTFLDTCLIKPNSDSLVILYRQGAWDDWREVSKYTKIKLPGGKIGFIYVDTLKLGEYTFANKNGSNPGIGIKENLKSKTEIKLFPNPASNSVTVRIENSAVITADVVEIINAEGKVIYSGNFTGEEAKIDCATYAKGNYFVRILRNKKVIAQEKLVLQ